MTNSDRTTSADEAHVLKALTSLSVASEETEHYGIHPRQYVEWYGERGNPVLCIVHGGFFREGGELDYLRPAALALSDAGYRVALAELRFELGAPQHSFEDIATLARHPELASAQWISHSSGSIFALHALFSEELEPSQGVLLAPVFDLERMTRITEDVADRTAQWLGGMPDELPEVYNQWSPWNTYQRLGAANLLSRNLHFDVIYGSEDATVPRSTVQNLPEEVFNLAVVPDNNHADLVRPGSDAWVLLLGALSQSRGTSVENHE